MLQLESINLQHSTFFMVQLSHLYMTSGKTTALTIQAFVGKTMSLLFNMLSRFVIASFPRSKHLLISRLQSLSTVILEPKKTKSVTASPFPPYICREVIRLASMILAFSMLSYKPASLQIHILKSSSPGHQNGTLSGDGVSKKQ